MVGFLLPNIFFIKSSKSFLPIKTEGRLLLRVKIFVCFVCPVCYEYNNSILW